MNKPENPPAFPHPGGMGNKGMTLRDYFAGQALGPILTEWYQDTGLISQLGLPGDDENPEIIAGFAYIMADAMLAERDKGR